MDFEVTVTVSVQYVHTEFSCLVTISLTQECTGEGVGNSLYHPMSVTELGFGCPMIMMENFNQARKINHEIILNELFLN